MSFRHSMTWLHTWSGLVLGWLLYFMFVTGSTGYFDEEILRWMQPEIPLQESSISASEFIETAERRLDQVATNATETYIELPLGRSPFFSIWWHEAATPETGPRGLWHNEKLNPNTGKPVITRETEGGEFLYRLHYALHYIPGWLAYALTSLAAMFMLVAIISGVIIHRRIFKDFFSFRRNKQRSWLDLHNLFGVLPLPFHLMITYSGLVLLMFSTMLPVPASSYGVGEGLRAIYDEVFTEHESRSAAGVSINSKPTVSLYKDALKRSDGGLINYVAIKHPGDKNAVIEMGVLADEGIDQHKPIHYDGVSGELYEPEEDPSKHSSAKSFYDTMEILHEGLFARPLLRWLYFLSGLMGAGMMATGSLLWAVNRRKKHTVSAGGVRGLALVDRLNLGTIVGLPIAIAAYFWANRLLAVDLVSRANWEMNSLFIVWGIALLHPFLRWKKTSLENLWCEQLLFATTVYALIPVLNAATSEHHLGKALLHGDWVMAGFDLFMLVLAMCFAITAHKLRRRIPILGTANSAAGVSA